MEQVTPILECDIVCIPYIVNQTRRVLKLLEKTVIRTRRQETKLVFKIRRRPKTTKLEDFVVVFLYEIFGRRCLIRNEESVADTPSLTPTAPTHSYLKKNTGSIKLTTSRLLHSRVRPQGRDSVSTRNNVVQRFMALTCLPNCFALFFFVS